MSEEDDKAKFINALIEHYGPNLERYLTRKLDNPADAAEVAQEAFLRILEKGHLYSYPRRFSTWLFTIARNLVTDFRKKKRAITSESAIALYGIG